MCSKCMHHCNDYEIDVLFANDVNLKFHVMTVYIAECVL